MSIIHSFFDNIIEIKRTGSTNDLAEQFIIENKSPGNFLIKADEQTVGKGRNNNYWFSPRGGIWMTIGLFSFPIDINLTLFFGKVIHETLVSLFPELKNKLKIKWPNDLIYKDKKIGGILSKHLSNSKYHLIGIGLDTNIDTLPPEIINIAASLKSILNRSVDNEKIILNLFNRMELQLPDLLSSGLSVIIKYLKQNSYLLNKSIVLDTDFHQFRGEVVNFQKDGAIILRLESGIHQPFYSGHIILE